MERQARRRSEGKIIAVVKVGDGNAGRADAVVVIRGNAEGNAGTEQGEGG
jgi:hypothetical protein